MNFLFEVGLEEIPARMITAAQAELARRVEDILTRERLWVPHPSPEVGEGWESAADIHSYSTPRRLAVLVSGVEAAQADAQEQLTGPSWAIAFKNGEPTPAAHAFAKKAGVEVSALQKITTQKGEYVSAVVERKGRTASDILAEQLPKELGALYWPKNMYWRAGKPERFVRPVKWLLALLDHAIVPVEFAGVHAANLTYGHRILHGDGAVTIEHAGDYLGKLEAAFVIVDVELRRHRIRKGLDAATRTIDSVVQGARWREDEALVDTVTHLTEWPSVLLGGFEPEYLSLPEEVLVTVMRDHQKYFAVEDAQGELASYFLTVLNTQPTERAAEIIRQGNERVLRSRFNDARFFWTVDQKIPLVDRVEMLKAVTFQKDLGNYQWKTDENLRLAKDYGVRLAAYAELTGNPSLRPNLDVLTIAVQVAKTDLTCELVKEFTELQGVVGGLYAKTQGLGEQVAEAVSWQYRPANIEDQIPQTIEGQLLGLADRIHTIVTMFSIGNAPTGSKDPFALRRAAAAVVTILAKSDLPFGVNELCRPAIDEVGRALDAIVNERQTRSLMKITEEVREFLTERLNFYLMEVGGFAYDVVNAVMTAGHDDVRDAIARAEALTKVRGSEDFTAIAAAFKRIKNILRQAEEKKQFNPQDQEATQVKGDLLVEPSEKALFTKMGQIADDVEYQSRCREYRPALELIATLRPHVDLFFDKVMVMVDDPDLRSNRLALIAGVLGNFSSIADFSEIVTSQSSPV